MAQSLKTHYPQPGNLTVGETLFTIDALLSRMKEKLMLEHSTANVIHDCYRVRHLLDDMIMSFEQKDERLTEQA